MTSKTASETVGTQIYNELCRGQNQEVQSRICNLVSQYINDCMCLVNTCNTDYLDMEQYFLTLEKSTKVKPPSRKSNFKMKRQKATRNLHLKALLTKQKQLPAGLLQEQLAHKYMMSSSEGRLEYASLSSQERDQYVVCKRLHVPCKADCLQNQVQTCVVEHDGLL